MPNWCYTEIKIYCKDDDKAIEFEKLLKEWTSNDYMQNWFNTNWLGNVVLGSGVGTIDTGMPTDVRCRGSIVDMFRDGSIIVVDTETAWVPMMKMWVRIADQYLDGAKIVYTAEECGCCLYYTNDPDLDGTYVIDNWGCDEIESVSGISEGDVVEVLQQVLKTDESDFGKLSEMFEKSPFFDLFAIERWKTVDINNLD